MNKEVKITTGEQLISFMEAQNLNSERITEILAKGLCVFADEKKAPENLIQEFKEYWKRYKDVQERPLFLSGKN